MATGTFAARAKSRKGIIPGNLICYKGSVISLGIDSLYRFFQIEPLQKEVAAALAADPNNPVELANLANIELDEGKISPAITHARKSYDILSARLDPRAASSRVLLVEALLADLGRDFAAARGTVGELEKLVVLDGERTSFMRLLAQGLSQTGDHLGALDAYLRLIDLPGGQSEPEVVNSVLSVRRDRWIRARAAELYAAVTSEERAKFDEAVTERLGKALAAKEAKDLRRFIAYFGFHPAADEARQQLFAQLKSEMALERELLLEDLEHSPDAARRRAAVAQMASFLNDANKYDEAAIYYHRLETEFPNVVCISGKTGKQLVEDLPADSPIKRAVAQASPWPEGTVRREGSDVRFTRNIQQQRPFALAWRGARPAIFDTVSIAFDQPQQTVVGRDGIGHERFRVSINESGQRGLGFQPLSPDLNFATAQGHLLVVNLGNQVLALDTLRAQGTGSRTLWQQELVELTPNPFNGQPPQTKEIRLPWGVTRHVPSVSAGGASLGVVGPLLNRCILVARGRDLTAFDPLTGEVLWSRRGIEPGSEVFGDDEAIVVAPPDSMKDGKTLILRSVDGEELGSRKIARADHRWAYCGRRCLWGRVERDGKLSFILSDPWKEKDLVLGTFEGGVKPALVGDEIAAFFEPKGHFLMVALDDGRKLIDTKLEAEPKLDNIGVERSPDQYLLFVNHAAAQPLDPSQPISQALMGAGGGLTPASGHIYAFDRSSLKPMWPAPAAVENYYALANQGLDLPVLVLLRLQGRRTPGGGDTKPAILCLDRRNGRALLDPPELDLNQPNNFFTCELSGDRDRKTVTIAMPSQSNAQ
ncbi:MAG TPA: PQQ-binding-like beta-propeller repeat protein, partial [Pirellulales bacterium]|nr:PQQ-binding-like beta-propeller repeat protein [Pirellulales bacterium]